MGRDPNEGHDDYVRKQAMRMLRVLYRLEEAFGEFDGAGLMIKEIRVRGPEATGAGYMLVIKAVDETRKPYVAFGGGDTFSEALSNTVSRMDAQGLQMREDVASYEQKAPKKTPPKKK
jgi:hypothetical protein